MQSAVKTGTIVLKVAVHAMTTWIGDTVDWTEPSINIVVAASKHCHVERIEAI